MDELNSMDILDLPDIDSLNDANPAENAEQKAASDDMFEFAEADSSASDSLDDIAVPELSDMLDGPLEAAAAAAKPQPQKKEEYKISDISETIPAPQSTSPKSTSAQSKTPQSTAGYTPVTANTSGSYTTYNVQTGSTGRQKESYDFFTKQQKLKSSEYFGHLSDEQYELAQAGKKKAQVIGAILIVFNALNILLGFSISTLIVSGLYIGLAVCFMKGSGKVRIYLGVMSVVNAFKSFSSMFLIDSMNGLFAEIGMSFMITIMQLILIISSIVYLVFAYFYIFDKSIAAYADRN